MNPRSRAALDGTTKVKQESLDELHRISRQADKLAARVERLEPVYQAAFVFLMHSNGLQNGTSSEADYTSSIEALRTALLSVTA